MLRIARHCNMNSMPRKCSLGPTQKLRQAPHGSLELDSSRVSHKVKQGNLGDTVTRPCNTRCTTKQSPEVLYSLESGAQPTEL